MASGHEWLKFHGRGFIEAFAVEGHRGPHGIAGDEQPAMRGRKRHRHPQMLAAPDLDLGCGGRMEPMLDQQAMAAGEHRIHGEGRLAAQNAIEPHLGALSVGLHPQASSTQHQGLEHADIQGRPVGCGPYNSKRRYAH